MIKITGKPISPELVLNRVKTADSGCVVTYVGVVRQHSRGKSVTSVEYQDPEGVAASRLQKIADEAMQRWQLENISITHRTGTLKVGDINLVVAVASAHRGDGFAASQFIIDEFKRALPTHKNETYEDGSRYVEEE